MKKNWKMTAAAALLGIGVCITGCTASAKTETAEPQQGGMAGGQKRMKIWFDTGGGPGNLTVPFCKTELPQLQKI